MGTKILGLDLGPNSIGWAMIERDEDNSGKILGIGSRIIPTDTELLSKFETGQAASKNAKRRQARGARRLKFRYKLRRQRLIDALKILSWIPGDFFPGQQLPVSKETLDEMRAAFNTEEVSDDWVVYYLRHKALAHQISKSELARILYHLNQRRGFRSNRKAGNLLPTDEGELSEKVPARLKQVEIVQIKSVEDSGEKSKGNTVFNVELIDGRSGTIHYKVKPEWEGQELELEITTITTKNNETRREFRFLSNSDADKWAKQKIAREEDIRRSGYNYPGNYYFHQLKNNPTYIIKDVTIDRKFYQDELHAILTKQFELDPNLSDKSKIHEIAEKFYPRNSGKQMEIKNGDLIHLFLHDIIYYQRDLRSKKSSIGDCRYETKNYRDPVTGRKTPVKAAPISSPIFQEFRIWQTVNNIRILKRESRDEKGKLILDMDVTHELINDDVKAKLFDLFDSKEQISQDQVLKLIKISASEYLVNLYRNAEDKKLPGNETKALLRKIFKRADYTTEGEKLLADTRQYEQIWHLLYSVDDIEHGHIRNTLVRRFAVPEDKAEIIAKAPPFKSQYAALSQKAMRKLLPLMRAGKYWSWEAIDASTQQRLARLFSGEYDENISLQVMTLFEKHMISESIDCQGLIMPMASYAVYGAHSERNTAYFDRPEQVVPKEPLNLRNPIVEQVINETLRLVADVWNKFGRPYQIHIELARDLKKSAKERKEISQMIQKNEADNRRIAAILRELRLGNPNSLSDIERFKLWENQAGPEARAALEEIKFKRPAEPTREEIHKYKLWTEQKFISPYSGITIPISKLFSKDYEVDHIIPRSRLFNDSLENKIVVEAALNKAKGNMTAYAFIKGGHANGHSILSASDYEAHVKHNFARKKQRLLLSEDVPESFTNRQLVDSRYISRKVSELLAPVSENQRDPVIATTGSITSELRAAWGLGEKMKQLVKWRFERLQEMTGESYVWHDEQTDANGTPTGRKILRLRGYEKRIDHRHHALDALIVACTTRSHIKYLNDLNAAQYRERPGDDNLEKTLPKLLERGKNGYAKARKFAKPWHGFVSDAMEALAGVIVSFKKQIRLYGRKANRNIRYQLQPDGTWKKKMVLNTNKLSPYVRQSLHKATIMGRIELREYRPVNMSVAMNQPHLIADAGHKRHIQELLHEASGDVKKALALYKKQPIVDQDDNPLAKLHIIEMKPYFINRVDIASGFDDKRIEKIPDRVLREELWAHIRRIVKINESRSKDERIKPFSREGIEILNKNRRIPIRKVRTKEESKSKFEIRPGAYVEADKGTNLYFAIYENLEDPTDRKYESIPLRSVIEAKAAGTSFVVEKPGYRWFTLSPGDLVYMPDDSENLAIVDWIDTKNQSSKVYKMVSNSGTTCYFIPHSVSKVIVDHTEFESLNKSEKSIDSRVIKAHCIKLKVNRLGNIRPHGLI